MIVYYHGNTIVCPGDTALLFGEGLDCVVRAEVGRLNDGRAQEKPGYIAMATPVSAPTEEQVKNACAPVEGEYAWETQLLQPCRQSVKIQLPEDEKQGVFAVTLAGAGEEVTLYINAPVVQWAQGDNGGSATPGGWLRLSGECLRLDEAVQPTVVLEQDGEYIPVPVTKVHDAYSVEIAIPETFSEGSYKAYLHNGFGGDTAWSMPVEVVIAQPEVRPDTLFNVRDFGAQGDGRHDDTENFRAALAAAGKNGGGVVYIPRGRYRLTDPIFIPDHTTLRGQSLGSVQVFFTPYRWPLNHLPEALIEADSDVTIEDIDFHGTRVNALFRIGLKVENAKNIIIRRVHAIFNALAGQKLNVGCMERRADILRELVISCNPPAQMMRIVGDNVQITDCEFYSTGSDFGWVGTMCKKNFLFRNNRVVERICGWSYFAKIEKGIMEDNEFEGCSVGFGGESVYFARNYIHDVLNHDREIFSTDMSYGNVCAVPAEVRGRFVRMPEGTPFKEDRVSMGGMYVTSGTGAGQARRIVGYRDGVIELDAPFACELDETSYVSYGGTFRTAYYLVGNRLDNGGPVNTYCDQCSTVIDGNRVTRAAGIVAYSYSETHATSLRSEDQFTSIVNNVVEHGNYFHQFGYSAPEEITGWEEFMNNYINGGEVDTWAHYSYLGAQVRGATAVVRGMLVRGNRLSENARIFLARYRWSDDEGEGVISDAIIERNEVRDSEKGIEIEVPVERLLLRGNRLTENVDAPFTSLPDNETETLTL